MPAAHQMVPGIYLMIQSKAHIAAPELSEGCRQRVRFDRVPAFSFEGLRQWYQTALPPGTVVSSDGLLGFEVMGRDGLNHDVFLPPRGKVGTEN